MTAMQVGCEGVAPLTARLDAWQRRLLAEPERVRSLVDRFGSPVNVLDVGPMERNAGEIAAGAAAAGVDLRIFFARKANKALCFVDEALRLGLGIDVASARELEQSLAHGALPEDVILTAAVKPAELLRRCAGLGVTVAVDNHDELDRIGRVAATIGSVSPVPIALRIAAAGSTRRPSRFGFEMEEAVALIRNGALTRTRAVPLAVTGVHFHADGYDAADRADGIAAAIDLVTIARAQGHATSFIDMGGGIPMRYLDDEAQWNAFWDLHRSALRDGTRPLTFGGHGLGLVPTPDGVVGTPNVYPAAQRLVREEWMRTVLQSKTDDGVTIAQALRTAGIALRCEPGRSLLDGCGVTLAEVTFRKQVGRECVIGLTMNRTQCRSSADDTMIDPILVPCGAGERRFANAEGFLVGAYCIERELITWRRLRFLRGVALGDVFAFPNTAGYFMHILESGSHQMPLAANVLLGSGGASRDAIDATRTDWCPSGSRVIQSEVRPRVVENTPIAWRSAH